MALFSCPICSSKRSPFKPLCSECHKLFNIVQENLGKMGLSELLDKLIATGIDKPKVKQFLEANPEGSGSILDQITAGLTNDLAEGMGVKEKEMTADDVSRLRENPESGISTKPIEK